MKGKLLLFVIIIYAMMSNAQIPLSEAKNSDQHFVKHVNLITKTQEIWQTEKSLSVNKLSNETEGSEGALMNFSSLEGDLKSMDLSEIIERYPEYPERTILFIGDASTHNINPGVLIDPKHILAGGDQYYAFENNPENFGFTSMDNYKVLDDLGYAYATDIYYFGTSPTDYQNNMVLITLSRPLGAIIGWMGFGYSTEDAPYNQNTFYVTALEPNNENQLTFEKYIAKPDMILSNGFYFLPYKDLIPGAPFYNNNSATHGIVSHFGAVDVNGNTTMYDGATRITSEKYNSIASILLSDRPDQADIMPLHLSVEPGIINAEDDFNEFIFYLHNYAETSYSGTITIDIYLSTDNVIETSDTKLTSYSTGAVTLGALYSAHYQPTTKPKLPDDLEPGLYFLGAIINTDDANLQNNTTPPAECAAVLVTNPNSSNYISGKINTSGDSPGEGYCLLIHHNENKLGGMADIAQIGSDLKFSFENIEDGNYILTYIPENSNNHRNIPTYYESTALWQDATVLSVSDSDTIKNIVINRIELPALTGLKTISGLLTKSNLKSGTSKQEDDFFDDVTLLLFNNSDQTITCSSSPEGDGNYIFECLMNGTYNIFIDKPGFTQVSSSEVTLSDEIENLENINFEFNSDSTIKASSATGAMFFDKDTEFYIYPNPVSDILTIKTNLSVEQMEKLIICAVDGNIVLSTEIIESETLSVDVSQLPAGIYFTRLMTDKNSISRTFVKE